MSALAVRQLDHISFEGAHGVLGAMNGQVVTMQIEPAWNDDGDVKQSLVEGSLRGGYLMKCQSGSQQLVVQLADDYKTLEFKWRFADSAEAWLTDCGVCFKDLDAVVAIQIRDSE